MSSNRRRKNRSIRWATWFWTGFIVSTMVGFYASPITALRKVRVVGADPADRERVSLMLQSVQGRAAGLIFPRRVESLALANTAIADADFSRNVFGRGRLVLKPRVPVAAIRNRAGLLIDRQGQIFSGTPPSGLLWLRVPDSALNVQASFGASWEASRMAGICSEIAQSSLPVTMVAVAVDGGIELQLEQGCKAILGSSNQATEKLTKLSALVQQRPDLLKAASEVNLTVPDRPTYTPRQRS